jgi:hypothetical protein
MWNLGLASCCIASLWRVPRAVFGQLTGFRARPAFPFGQLAKHVINDTGRVDSAISLVQCELKNIPYLNTENCRSSLESDHLSYRGNTCILE